MRGFSLITALLVILLVTTLGWGLIFRILRQWEMATQVKSQLYGFVLAENGIEYARTLLPHLNLNSLLVGTDGLPCEGLSGEWRSPMSFAQSLRVDPATWNSPCEDGLPAHDGEALIPRGYQAEGGHFFLRFSNNPEETSQIDEDYIVLVRSLAIVPDRVRSPFLPSLKNPVALD